MAVDNQHQPQLTLPQQARDYAQSMETLADMILNDIQSGNYGETPPNIVELHNRIYQLRPVIDALLGGADATRWQELHTLDSQGGIGLIILGMIIGAVITYFLLT